MCFSKNYQFLLKQAQNLNHPQNDLLSSFLQQQQQPDLQLQIINLLSIFIYHMNASQAQSFSVNSLQFYTIRQSMVNRRYSTKRRKILLFIRSTSMLLFFLYTILPFFKKAYKQVQTDVTAVLFSIPNTIYDTIEICIMVLMILDRFAHHHFSRKKIITKRTITLSVFLVIVIFTNIFARYWLIDLMIRPFFLICYSTATLELCKKFGKIVYGNFLYYVLMWMFIIIFSSIGHMLFKQYDMETENIFNNYYDAFFELIVLQATSNYPDVALPYYEQNKANIFVFITFIFISTVTINGFIIASSYRTYQQLNKEDENQESLRTLLSFIKIKLKKLKEDNYIKTASKWRMFGREMLLNPFVKIINWTINVMIFMLACYYPESYTDHCLTLIFIFMIITSSNCILTAITKPLKTIPLRPFLLYDVLISFSGLLIVFLVIVGAIDEIVFKVYMFFRTPVIVKPILLLMFKNRVISDAASTNQINGNISQITIFNKFIPEFLRIVFLLFINLLFFSAIGQMAFAGAFTEDSRQILIDAKLNKLYVYLNFNNTLTSFNTLFTLLIVNNWNLIVHSYAAIFQTTLVRVFFIFHYMASVLVAYNVLVVAIIEFVSILSEYKQKSVRISEDVPNIGYDQLPILKELVEYYIENSIYPEVEEEVVEKKKPDLIQKQLKVLIQQMKIIKQ